MVETTKKVASPKQPTKSKRAPKKESEDVQAKRDRLLSQPELRLIGLYGPLNDENTSSIVFDLFGIRESIRAEEVQKLAEYEECLTREEDEDGEVVECCEPEGDAEFQFVICSEGGNVWDMFAVYDMLRDVQRTCTVITHGIGKVMSAAVLLLAAGSKGKRKISRNCRVMMHEVSAEHGGTARMLTNELKEVNYLQDRYIDSLVSETKMTRKQILTMFEKSYDVYMDAEEAVKLGIADIII